MEAWASGDHSEGPWTPHTTALDLMYNAMDALHLHSTQWNYTASNSNDLRIGDGWNQEDLSIFSRDQQTSPNDINSGGRALKGFVRPYVKACAGIPGTTRFDSASGTVELTWDAEPGGVTEIFVPSLQYPDGFDLKTNASTSFDAEAQMLLVTSEAGGAVSLLITRRG